MKWIPTLNLERDFEKGYGKTLEEIEREEEVEEVFEDDYVLEFALIREDNIHGFESFGWEDPFSKWVWEFHKEDYSFEEAKKFWELINKTAEVLNAQEQK